MGAWGTDPWDNDTAADWFGGLWEGTPIAARVLETLRESDDGSQVVAAAWLVAQLGRVYVWPIEHLDDTLDAAVAALDQVLAGEDEEGYLEEWEHDPDVVGQVQSLRDEIDARRRPPED